MNDQTRNTQDSVQVCSILHVAHVGVRRVTLVIVHNGHQDVVLVVSSFAWPFVRELLYREIFYLQVTSMYFSGIGNDSSLGELSLTWGST